MNVFNFLGSSKLVLRPKTSEEVSKIMKYCNDHLLAVCPQSGNTGLVGGSTPIFDELIISMSLMNEIYHFDDNTGKLLLLILRDVKEIVLFHYCN